MAAVREMAQVRLVRPLLGVAKARLVALLDREGQEYLQDPSNRNPAFERSRLRIEAEARPMEYLSSPPGLTRGSMEMAGSSPAVTRLIAEISAHAAARLDRERALEALLARTVSLHPAGFALIDPAPIAAAGELGERALGRVAATFGGAVYPLRRARLLRLREALGAAPLRARTLGGCRFVPWRGRVLVLREPARAEPALSLAPGMSARWDRRFEATLPATASGAVTIGLLGTSGAAALARDAAGRGNPLPRLVYPTLPAIRDAIGLAAVPHLAYRRPTAEHLPALSFRPAVSLFSAGFTVV
jgi:tRNA(Ile)-lysidine synthase